MSGLGPERVTAIMVPDECSDEQLKAIVESTKPLPIPSTGLLIQPIRAALEFPSVLVKYFHAGASRG